MFSRLTRNNELVNTDPLLLEEHTGLGSCKPLTITSLSNDHVYVCVFLFKRTYCNIYCWCINIGLRVLNTVAHAWTKLIQSMHFSLRRIIAFVHVGDQIALQQYDWGPHETTHHQQKNTDMNRAYTDSRTENKQQQTCLQYRSWKKAEQHLVQPQQVKCILGDAKAFHWSIHVCEWPQKHCDYWFWGSK